MNAKHLIAAVAVLASAGSVLAQDYVPPDAGFSSTKTRAEVIAELHQARADGSLNYSDHSYPVLKAETSRKTREQVQAELVQYRAQHPYGGLDHDYSGGD